MEYVGQQNIKTYCNFYVSDLHLSVMLLPYLSKQINEDVEITTIFENVKKENIEEVLEKLNVKNKEKILNINWFNSNKDKNEEIEDTIKNNLQKKKQNVVIIGGNEDYINENNSMIFELLNNVKNINNIKVINCYNIEEIKSDMSEIVKQYDGILNTSGEIGINENKI